MVDEEDQTEASHQQMERPAGLLRYDREELLRLQHGALGGHLQQEEWWMQHLKDLGPEVAEELEELQAVPETSPLRRRSKNSERRLRSKARREALKAVSIDALGSDTDEHHEDSNFLEDSSDASLRVINENIGRRRSVGKGSRRYESYYADDLPEVESFQPRAFAVEGEPDFESGEPVDGWEYLRRVKYETARCPKVVVAEIDPAKLVSEQTPYMPELPEIPECPLDLRPSKEWETHLLGDFSLLRMALSNIRAPPTAERIPSLRNKTAWEMRCFGSTTAMEDEESKEPDAVTTKYLAAEPGNEDSVTEGKVPLLPSVDTAKHDSKCAAIESRSEHENDDKKLLEPFIELVESQIERMLNSASIESSYVIDLGLITDFVPSNEPEELFNESVYLISGEPIEADDDSELRKAVHPSAGISEPEDCLGQRAESLDSQTANPRDHGHVEGSSFEIINHFEHLSIGEPVVQHGDDEGMRGLSSHPTPGHMESDQLMTDDFVGSTGAHDLTEAVAQADEELLHGIEIQDIPPSKRGFEDAAIQYTQPYFNFDEVEREDVHSETADYMTSLGGEAWALDEGDFGEFYSGIDSHLDSLTMGDPEFVQGEEEAKLPSFSATNIPELDDVDLPTADFTDSLIGLEIFRSGNVLVDDPDEGVDGPGHGTDFRIDGPLEELFNKVFQLVGVSRLPFIHLLLRLDEVSRAALFRHHVSWLENVDGLPKDRVLWLLALSAVVDVPLDSQTSAAFRALLRHCSGVRALKQTRDDEDLYLLNVLITVAGVYFGQAEAGLP
ncbi:unnamed protein product [Calypogeia fissa]